MQNILKTHTQKKTVTEETSPCKISNKYTLKKNK